MNETVKKHTYEDIIIFLFQYLGVILIRVKNYRIISNKMTVKNLYSEGKLIQVLGDDVKSDMQASPADIVEKVRFQTIINGT